MSMHTTTTATLLILLTASACGEAAVSADAQDSAPGVADAALVDAGAIDAARPAIFDAAPRPDAIPGFTCAAPITLNPGQSQLGDTSNYSASSSGSCSSGSASSNDTIYRVPLPAEPTDVIANVLVDTDVAVPFDAVLAIQSTCGDVNSEQACSDFSFSESVEALALTNEAFVLVDGTAQFGGSATGPYQLDVSTRSIAPIDASCDPLGLSSRCQQGLFCAGGTCQTESPQLACAQAAALQPGLIQHAHTHAYQGDLFQGSCAFDTAAGAGEALFSFRLDQASDIDITTDLPGTTFDTVLYLIAACDGTELACADDVAASAGNFSSRLQTTNLPAGDYLLVIDGSSTAAPTGRVSVRLDVSAR